MNSRIFLSIDEISLDFRNPRLEESQNQKEALSSMLKNQKDKIYTLAVDILEKGLNPSENIIIKKENELYIVLEGNRRITSLKLLKNPELLSDIDEDLYKKFTKLHEEFIRKPIDKIECVNIKNEDEALYWINLKHTGENKGKGTVPWTTTQQQLFQVRYQKKTSREINILNFIEKYGVFNGSYKNKLGNIPLTSLKRLLSDPKVRKTIGIEFRGDNNTLFPINGRKLEEAIKFLEEISKDFISKKIKVTDIYTKEDRALYISKVKDKIQEKQENVDLNSITKETTTTLSSNPVTEKKKIVLNEDNNTSNSLDQKNLLFKKSENKNFKSYPTTKIRKYLIPTTFRLRINSQRINNIFKELKIIDIETYPNSVAILFRVFLELSLDKIIERKKLLSSNNMKLVHKLEAVKNYMKKNKIMNKEELKIINIVISTKDHLFSIATLNSYVHNEKHSPTSNDLKTHWDNFEVFIEKIWYEIEGEDY